MSGIWNWSPGKLRDATRSAIGCCVRSEMRRIRPKHSACICGSPTLTLVSGRIPFESNRMLRAWRSLRLPSTSNGRFGMLLVPTALPAPGLRFHVFQRLLSRYEFRNDRITRIAGLPGPGSGQCAPRHRDRRRPKRLWPHVKTHKLPQLVRMQLSHGIRKYKCATIAEAEMLALEKGGSSDDRVPGCWACHR